MTMLALIIFISVATIFALSLYFASGFKHSIALYIVSALLLIIGYGSYALGYFGLLRSVLFAVCASATLVAVLHDLIIVTKEPIDEKYFDLLNFGIMIFIIPILLKAYRKGLSADDIWFVTFLALPVFAFFCRKAKDKHRSIFLFTGTSAIFIALCCIILHPLVAGVSLSVENLRLSFKLGSAWYALYGAFFLANYAKLGILRDSSVHKKVFAIYVALIVINLTTRYPALEPFKDITLIKGLTEASTVGLFVLPPSLGLIVKRTRERPLTAG